jgi:UDP:flavonoid glycosyltransferase YjiC (YdhE family)
VPNGLTDGFTQDQLRTVRIRIVFLCLKALTDFLTAAGIAFTASAIEAKGTPTPLVITVAVIGGVVAAAKNLGDAISAALPPPVLSWQNSNPLRLRHAQLSSQSRASHG